MGKSRHVLPLYDAEGALHGILLSPELWRVAGPRLEPVLNAALAQLEPQAAFQEPLEDWESFLQYWDFKYPVEASVSCKICGASTENWQEDPKHPFMLKSAQLEALWCFCANHAGPLCGKNISRTMCVLKLLRVLSVHSLLSE